MFSLESIWWTGVFVAVAAVCLALGKFAPANRLRLHTRILPATAGASDEKSKEGSRYTPYKHILPPQCRQALRDLTNGEVQPVDTDDILHNLVPMTLPYTACQGNKYTPTGISVQEIRALKDFPDYTALCGLPLPQPYHGFNIDTALPRPYRPFRWPYHQTMCELSEKSNIPLYRT